MFESHKVIFEQDERIEEFTRKNSKGASLGITTKTIHLATRESNQDKPTFVKVFGTYYPVKKLRINAEGIFLDID